MITQQARGHRLTKTQQEDDRQGRAPLIVVAVKSEARRRRQKGQNSFVLHDGRRNGSATALHPVASPVPSLMLAKKAQGLAGFCGPAAGNQLGPHFPFAAII